MFGLPKKNVTLDIKQTDAPTVASPDVSGLRLHTIPSKFLPKLILEGSSRTRKIVVWIAVILVVSGLFILASVLLVRSVRTNEAVKVQANVNIPRIQNVNSAPVESRIIERDLGSCVFSHASAGYDQELTFGDYQVKGYSASYFCETGSIGVQIWKFDDGPSLAGRIGALESSYRVFRDALMQDVNDEQKILWGSDIFLVQISANSLVLDDTNVSVLTNEYIRLYPPSHNLPWKLAPIVALKTPEERDAKRVSDIKKVQIALEFYKVDKKVYPTALDQTVDPDLRQYLAEIPQNPSPGGTPYQYMPKQGGASYEISFSLEVGSGGIPAGEVVARPQGVFARNRNMASALPSSLDTDGDGLTDAEELLWGTDPAQADSDQDTYGDGKEVRDGFDPLASGDARLESSSEAKNYVSSTGHIAVLYPSLWTATQEDSGQVMFESKDKRDFFEVLIEERGTMGSLVDWYRNEFSVDEVSLGPSMINLSGADEAIASPDGLTVFALFQQKFYTITYNPGVKEALDYQTTFQMFLRSLKFFENPTP